MVEPRRLLLPVAACLAVVILAGLSWWTGVGPLASSTPGLAPHAIRPGDIPRCGPFWRVVDGPNPSKDYNELHAIAAMSPRDVWAVGTFGTEEFALTLVEHWDGTRWSHVPSLSVSDYSNHLYGVVAVSGGDAWAVGASHRGTDVWHTLAMHWNGAKWSITPTPNVAAISALNAVVALSENDVWAVGESSMGSKGQGSQTLIEHWNGRAWSIVPSPNGGPNSTLSAVAAIAKDDIWAAGSYTDKSGALSKPLFMRWDGSAWKVSPNDGAGAIWSLAAVSKSNVWAVGNNGPQAVIMRWDGALWAAVPGPASGAKNNILNSVTAAAANDVWAVGSQSINGADQTLAIHWDGAKWLTVPSPSINNYVDTLNAAAALSNHDVWAVGSSIADTHGTNLALVQHYSDPCP